MFALAQGQLWQAQRGGLVPGSNGRGPRSMPVYVNPALGEGPLGDEDAQNFHP
jgi:hypothetical protein